MIFIQLKEQLESLKNLLLNLSIEQYKYPSKHLGNATIGGHTRHIIELLQCAVSANKTGMPVDYVNRKRDLNLEYNLALAREVLMDLTDNCESEDSPLQIKTDQSNVLVNSSYHREILYNLEHIIHHFALIKVALIEQNIPLTNENFGIAYSTISYKKSLANS